MMSCSYLANRDSAELSHPYLWFSFYPHWGCMKMTGALALESTDWISRGSPGSAAAQNHAITKLQCSPHSPRIWLCTSISAAWISRAKHKRAERMFRDRNSPGLVNSVDIMLSQNLWKSKTMWEFNLLPVNKGISSHSPKTCMFRSSGASKLLRAWVWEWKVCVFSACGVKLQALKTTKFWLKDSKTRRAADESGVYQSHLIL